MLHTDGAFPLVAQHLAYCEQQVVYTQLGMQAGMILRLIQGRRSTGNGPSSFRSSTAGPSASEAVRPNRAQPSGQNGQDDRSTPEMRDLVCCFPTHTMVKALHDSVWVLGFTYIQSLANLVSINSSGMT